MSFAIDLQVPKPEAVSAKRALLVEGDYPGGQIRTALHAMLASTVFCKAQRMCRLMRFLVDMALLGKEHELNEYAIGIAVFDRDARNYYPGEDPVVRVNVGRLREKLRVYYSGPGHQSEWRFSIPLGTYRPLIQRLENSELSPEHRLTMSPLASITQDAECRAFTQGLNEELSHQLFKLFGSHMVSYHATPVADSVGHDPSHRCGDVRYQLEGSVRIKDRRLRLTLRLIDAEAGVIAWSELFDREHDFSLSAQNAIACAVRRALQTYLGDLRRGSVVCLVH